MEEGLRRTDVLIAEFLGCKVVDPESSLPKCACLHYPHSQEMTDFLKPYSGDLLLAMEVVEKMRADGWSWKAWQPSLDDLQVPTDAGAVVSFICHYGPCEKHGNPHCNYHGACDVRADTLPLAICKAALLALRKGEPS